MIRRQIVRPFSGVIGINRQLGSSGAKAARDSAIASTTTSSAKASATMESAKSPLIRADSLVTLRIMPNSIRAGMMPRARPSTMAPTRRRV